MLIVFLAVSMLLSMPGTVHAKVEGTLPGDLYLYIYERGTGNETTGKNTINATIGDTLRFEVYLRNGVQDPVTGISLYFTVDETLFDIVSQGRNNDGSIRPFVKGAYMRSAGDPEPFDPVGNYTHGDSLTANDNGIKGWQMDYVVVSPISIGGTSRPFSNLRYGTVCYFDLVAKAPCDSATIRLDDDRFRSRFSRYNKLASSDTFLFRYFQTAYITVTGVNIYPPLPDILLGPSQSDSSLDLDNHINVSSTPDSLLIWTFSGNQNIAVSIDPATRVVTFQAPAGFRGAENITFTVRNPQNTIHSSDTIRVVVDARPAFTAALPDTVYIHEDSLETAFYLPDVVEDEDDAFENLSMTIQTGPNLTYVAARDTLYLKGTADFFGYTNVTLIVADSFALADTATVIVRVLPINDAPTLFGLPDITMQRNGYYRFDISEFSDDVDNDPLTVTWSASDNFTVTLEGYFVTIKGKPEFLGVEDIIFTVTDPGGLSASDVTRVTVTPSSQAPVWSKIPKIGFAQGRADSSLVLWDYVSDPDDPDSLLTFVITNNDNVDYWEVNERNGKLYLFDIDNRPGWDRLTVSAYDPDGNYSATSFIAFVAPADGTPIVGGIPDTTIVAGTQATWIDLDDFYYDLDHSDSQMRWTWGRMAGADSSATFFINPSSHAVRIMSISPDRTGEDRIFFTVTDPTGRFADDICNITVVADLSKPILTLPPKVGFVAGARDSLDLDRYVTDALYAKTALMWSWLGNTRSVITLEQPTALRTRPVSFTGPGDWTGWERVEFTVRNPLGGAAQDTLIVFSASADGTPVAGGLTSLTLTAGSCTSFYIDDYFYDADTPEHAVTWRVSGGDSIYAHVDPLSHVVEVCAPSETWEGQETLTFTVTDPQNNSASMDVTVRVTGAVMRNVLKASIVRNPMQEDYMSFYISAATALKAAPTLSILINGDSTRVALTTVQSGYYYGRYVLPLTYSLGTRGVANAVMKAVTTTNIAIQDTARFAYGYLGGGGGRIALGPFSADVPENALKSPVFFTVTEDYPDVSSAEKAVTGEIEFTGAEYHFGPTAFAADSPITIGFTVDAQKTGAGVFRMTAGGWVFAGAGRDGSFVGVETEYGGRYRLGYDMSPPRFRLTDPDEQGFRISVADYGSGVDVSSIRVLGGYGISWRFDTDRSEVLVFPQSGESLPGLTIEVIAADMTGNVAKESFSLDASAIPGQFIVGQNTPNPFNPSTHIPFTLTSDRRVRIEIYDMLGRRIRVLADDLFGAGSHSVMWDAADESGRQVSSGVYIYTVVSGGRSETRKMMFLR